MKLVVQPRAKANETLLYDRLLLVGQLAVTFLLCIMTMSSSAVALAPGPLPPPVLVNGDYSKFSHTTPREHSDLMGRDNCGSCHRRSDSSITPRFPLHRDCTGCHLVQFTNANSAAPVNPICTICHKSAELNSPNPPLKEFSGLITFRANFDHFKHLKGEAAARPDAGCLACHRPAARGVETIPAQLKAHEICYACHSPGKSAARTSSCGACHASGSYVATTTAARSFRLGFSHAEHSERARLTCERCHNVLRQGLPQSKQVSAILPVQHLTRQHLQNCAACHDGQHAFGVGADFTTCSGCHKRAGFGPGN